MSGSRNSSNPHSSLAKAQPAAFNPYIFDAMLAQAGKNSSKSFKKKSESIDLVRNLTFLIQIKSKKKGGQSVAQAA